MKFSDLARYGLWLLVAESADANRREYHMQTTWLPHLLTNSLSLLLPDVLRLLLPPSVLSAPAHGVLIEELQVIEQTLTAAVRDNPNYVVYVAPLAAGYILSHPNFNIYKGDLAKKRLVGFGLDALPHGATAFGLTALLCETAATAAKTVPPANPLMPLVKWAKTNPALFSGLMLTALTAFWEFSEYRVHVHELALRGGDPEKINMQWSVDDTARDCAANFVGWGLAILTRGRR